MQEAAILDVAATAYEFERGEEMTCEHALLAVSIGIKKLVVVVNKMNCLAESDMQHRFNEICTSLGDYLTKICYDAYRAVSFVHISGYHGDNLTEPSASVGIWDRGETLTGAIDSLERPVEPRDKLMLVNVVRGWASPDSNRVWPWTSPLQRLPAIHMLGK